MFQESSDDPAARGKNPDGPSPELPALDFVQLGAVAARTAFRVLRQTEDAEDVMQATLTALIVKVSGAGPLDNPEAWVTTVAKHLAVEVCTRRQALEARLQTIIEQDAGEHRDFVDGLVSKLLIDDMLEGLPLRQRQVLELRLRTGLSTASIASVLGVGAETVKTHLSRARAQIRARDERTDMDEQGSD